MGVFELFEDGDFAADFLLGDELIVHFLDGYFSAGADVPAAIDFAVGALPDTVLLCEKVVPHVNLHLFVHVLPSSLY